MSRKSNGVRSSRNRYVFDSEYEYREFRTNRAAMEAGLKSLREGGGALCAWQTYFYARRIKGKRVPLEVFAYLDTVASNIKQIIESAPPRGGYPEALCKALGLYSKRGIPSPLGGRFDANHEIDVAVEVDVLLADGHKETEAWKTVAQSHPLTCKYPKCQRTRKIGWKTVRKYWRLWRHEMTPIKRSRTYGQ